MDELSRDINSLLDSSHCSNSTFNTLFVEQPSVPLETDTLSATTPKRRRVEEVQTRGKVLLCFFPNSQATSALMESMKYVPKYEMIVPQTWKLRTILDKLHAKWNKTNFVLELQTRCPPFPSDVMSSPPQPHILSPLLDRLDVRVSELLQTSADAEGSISFEYSWNERGTRQTVASVSTIPLPTFTQMAEQPLPPTQQLHSHSEVNITKVDVAQPYHAESTSSTIDYITVDSSFETLGELDGIGENTCMEVLGALSDGASFSQSFSQSSQNSFTTASGQRKVKKRIAPTFIGHAVKTPSLPSPPPAHTQEQELHV